MILIDSGPLIAILVQSDPDHVRCLDALARMEQPGLVPAPCLVEVAYFLAREGLQSAEARLLRAVANRDVIVADAVAEDYARAADLVEQYSGFPLGTVDALIAAMAERLDVRTLFTLDRRHFGALRPAHCDAFTLVP